MARLTLKTVKTELAENSISIYKIAGEYKVYPKGTIGQAYFTDDLQDALMTGLSMARTAGTLVTRVERKPEDVALASDRTVIHTLGQLNAMLKPEAQGWTIRRSPAGYYYYTHPTKINTLSGTYVYSCKGTTLGFWRRELAAVIEEAR